MIAGHRVSDILLLAQDEMERPDMSRQIWIARQATRQSWVEEIVWLERAIQEGSSDSR